MKIKYLFIFILIFFLFINLLLDFSIIKDQLGKKGKDFVFKYIVPFKNINDLEKSIKELTKETVLLSAQKKMFEKAFNELNENLNELEYNQITFDQYIKYFDPSELDMIMKDKRIDLNYGYSSKRNIYDENSNEISEIFPIEIVLPDIILE